MQNKILNKIPDFLFEKCIEIPQGNIIIGKGEIDNFSIEIRYIYNSCIFLQILVDDVWSEERVWGEENANLGERIILYICHSVIHLEKSEIVIYDELNLSQKFSKTIKYFISISDDLQKQLSSRFTFINHDIIHYLIQNQSFKNPKISIITTVFNNAKLLEQTIQSVINQSYQEVEFVIKDAGSKDNFYEIIEKYRPYISKIICNPDKGVYYGMHEGILQSSGRFIACLNSDDIFAYPDVLKDVEKCIACNQTNAVYGNILIYKNGVLQLKKGSMKRLYRESSIYHPSLFLDKASYFEIGGFNFNYKIVADIDLIIRLIKKNKTFTYLDKAITIFRLGGTSTVNLLSYKEEIKCRLQNKKCNLIGYIYITLKTIKHLLFKI